MLLKIKTKQIKWDNNETTIYGFNRERGMRNSTQKLTLRKSFWRERSLRICFLFSKMTPELHDVLWVHYLCVDLFLNGLLSSQFIKLTSNL